MISCRTLGPVELLVDDGPAMPELLWRKHLALLIYLARSVPRARTREHLMGLLWPDKLDAAARHSLNEAIRVLRRHAGEASVHSTAGQVGLSPAAVQLDVDLLVHYTGKGEWEAAAALVSGEFMEGFSIPGASEFEDWLAAERQHWRGESVTALVHRADERERAGWAAEGARYARRALGLDPRSERALRSSIRCLALSGDRAAALQCYEGFRTRLASELGIQPDKETSALAGRVLQERGARAGPLTGLGRSVAGGDELPPLVGRESELDRLLATASDCLSDRRSAALIVEGDVGYGKSRLLHELAGRLRLEGATLVVARSVEADRDDAWGGLVALAWGGLVALARGGLLDAPGVAGAPARALSALAQAIPDWEARFRDGPASGEALPLGRALVEVLRAAVEERAMVLAVDDAHWLDRDSALVLGAALRDLAALPFTLILTVQPRWPRPELDEIRSRIGRELAGRAVSLAVLGRNELLTLARHFLPRYSDVELDRVVRRVSTDSAGVSFLAVELLRAVAHGLDLGGVSGAWPEALKTFDQTLPGDMPDTITAALRVTFRRLSPQSQEVLAAAAVIGDRVEPSTLANVVKLSLAEVQAALDEIEWHRWLAADARGYSFTARLTRLVIAQEMLTPGQRQRFRTAMPQGVAASGTGFTSAS